MSDPASVQREIEEAKQFALSLGMSPEQVAALYDAPDESPPNEGQPSSPRPPAPRAAEPMSKYRRAFLVWWITVVLLVTVFSAMGGYMYWDEVQADGSRFLLGLAVTIAALTSWIPWSFQRRSLDPNCP